MPDEPRPQTDNAQAIEAGAVVLAEIRRNGSEVELPAVLERAALRARLAEAKAVYDAMAPLIRRAVAEEIARAIEVAEGNRCPDCGGKAASKKWARNPNRTVGRCGGGHTWEQKHSGGPVWFPATIAREIGERHA
jgi:hypothetical protein